MAEPSRAADRRYLRLGNDGHFGQSARVSDPRWTALEDTRHGLLDTFGESGVDRIDDTAAFAHVASSASWETKMRRSTVGVVTLLLLSACGSEDCDSVGRAAVAVRVEDSVGQQVCDATVTAIDGEFSEELVSSGGSGDCAYHGVYERPGTYRLEASAGNATGVVEGVEVRRTGRCDVLQTVEVAVELGAELPIGTGDCNTVARSATVLVMSRTITQRELRNDSGEIMRSLDQGESFIVTRNGTPVGELTPLRRHRFVSTDTVVAMFRHAPSVDARRFRDDLDPVVDQDPTPRG